MTIDDQEIDDEEIDDHGGRPFRVIVTNIYMDGSHGHYIADMLIDGEPRSFKFEARGENSLSTEESFDDIFQYARGAGNIAVLIGEYHDGKIIDFPVDLGIMLDFSHRLALGGPEAAEDEPKPKEER